MNYQNKIFSCDFETTVYDGQTETEVWASACVELYTESVNIFHSISEQFEYFKQQNCNIIAYYHNLKFDGSFWLSFLLRDLQLEQAFNNYNTEGTLGEWYNNKEMSNNSFKYTISELGQWYTITIKINNYIIELRDSLKLLPFSVKEIGKAFKTKHQKLEMNYTGYRYSGCIITEQEREYISNDVLVVKEALEIMFEQGHNKLTIGACCLDEFKKTFHDKREYEALFPDLTLEEIDSQLYKYDNVDSYIRKSYRGGWCYLVKEKANKVKRDGTTADVNSLYPSMMSSESGNEYPYSKPNFWKGNYIPNEALQPHHYFFIRVKTRFYIKKGKLPFIQIKGNYLYKGTEALESSDYYDRVEEKYYTHYKDIHGNICDTRVEMTLTMTDYYLMLEHYEIVDFEILDGCYFRSAKGLFDEYINIYKKMKLENTGALRTLAKLFLNNLYGKMASSTDSSFKKAFVKDDGSIGFIGILAHDKKSGYIAIGSAITSYARNFTIRSAQQNYYGKDKRGFIYADTDSIHCDLKPNEIKGITVHDKNFCCWKLESCWDKAIFVRQKTYIEHVTHEDLQEVEQPYYNVKCAGMPSKCKDLFVKSMIGYDNEETKDLSEVEKEFLQTKRTLEDFKIGLRVPGKLLPKRIPGGVLLVDTSYEMR